MTKPLPPKRPKRRLLSPTHIEMLRLVGQGYTDKEVAEELGIQLGTARAHMSTILRRMQLHDRHAAVRAALKQGLL